MKKREKDMLSPGRVRDLADQAMRNDYVTHTGFLSYGLKWTRTTDLTLIRRAL